MTKFEKIFGKARILVAEDDPTNQILSEKCLTLYGCQAQNITIVENGKLVIQQLTENINNYFKLILMDGSMPELGGIETTKIIRNTLGMTIPIIALTADDNKEECINSGMNAYHQKPVDIIGLRKVLLDWLE
jgi:CheY-like chemotaxis protein